MNPIDIAKSFQAGEVFGPKGRIKALAAMITRRSLLVFTQQSVLKLRTPTVVDGLDQSLLSVRLGLAARERAVGLRLAPHAYLDPCALRISTEGELLLVTDLHAGEPVVATRRQPVELRADAALTSGVSGTDPLFHLMDRLADFHATAEEPRPEARWEARARRHWDEAMTALASAPDAVLDASQRTDLQASTTAWLAQMDKTLVHRATERRVRDLHGELSLEHIFMTEPPVVIDAADVATSDERFADVAEDVGRLAMELDLIELSELAHDLVAHYARAAVDAKLDSVMPFFKRLAALRGAADVLSDPGLDERDERARAFIALARSYRL